MPIAKSVALEVAFGDAAAAASLWTLLVYAFGFAWRVRQVIAWVSAIFVVLAWAVFVLRRECETSG